MTAVSTVLCRKAKEPNSKSHADVSDNNEHPIEDGGAETPEIQCLRQRIYVCNQLESEQITSR